MIRICLECHRLTQKSFCTHCYKTNDRQQVTCNGQPAYYPTMTVERLVRSIEMWEQWPSSKTRARQIRRRRNTLAALFAAQGEI